MTPEDTARGRRLRRALILVIEYLAVVLLPLGACLLGGLAMEYR